MKDYDPIGFKLMEQIWGKGDPRLKAKKESAVAVQKTPDKPKTESPKPTSVPAPVAGKDAEAAAEQKLELIDILVTSGKKDKARERLKDLIKQYADTASAKKAKDLLEKLEK